MARTALSKTIRFEVFKRDSFACQYCGAKAPDVLLQVDHIQPVALGGSDDLTNLITSCAPCNGGKGARPLDANTTMEKRRRELEQLQERREQLEMMFEWQKGLSTLGDYAVTIVAEFWRERVKPCAFNEIGLAEVRKLMARYKPDEIMAAMRCATDLYLVAGDDGRPTLESVNAAWGKTKALCHVNRAAERDPGIKELFYIRGILRKRLNAISRYPQYGDWKAMQLLKEAHRTGVAIMALRDLVLSCEAFRDFELGAERLIDEANAGDTK